MIDGGLGGGFKDIFTNLIMPIISLIIDFFIPLGGTIVSVLVGVIDSIMNAIRLLDEFGNGLIFKGILFLSITYLLLVILSGLFTLNAGAMLIAQVFFIMTIIGIIFWIASNLLEAIGRLYSYNNFNKKSKSHLFCKKGGVIKWS